MPEQLSRHPEVTLQVLKSAGAKCGEGAPQQILVQCPRERFCALPGGEVCVYGLPEARAMTQITAADWAALLPAGAAAPAAPGAGGFVLTGAGALVVSALVVLAIGVALGALLARRGAGPAGE